MRAIRQSVGVDETVECPGCGALIRTVETRSGELELIRLLGDDESPAVDAGGQVSDDEVTVRLHINFEPKAEGGYVGFDLISGSKYHECFGPRDWGGGGSGDRSPKPSAPPSPDATFSERKPPE